MATSTFLDHVPAPPALSAARVTLVTVLRRALLPLTSLRLTVALFAMAIFIVFVGTLAQVDKDMWEVIEQYFRSLIAWVDVQVFFPRSWFPQWQNIPGRFPFPGGALIGAALFVNLTAAHLLRFKIQAQGTRLWLGLAVIVAGALLTWLVIGSGHNQGGLQAKPPFAWATLWLGCKIGTVALWLASVAGVVWWVKRKTGRTIELILAAAGCLILTVLAVWIVLPGNYLGDPAMRILWQLIQGGLAGLVLLLGCWLVFKNSGGSVLLHAGIGLLMFGELFVSLYAVEERITIEEGATANYAMDIRATELAIINPAFSKTEDEVVAVPGSLLAASVARQEPIRDPNLPFDIQVVEYWKNSELQDPPRDKANLATVGLGLQVAAGPRGSGSGAGMESKVNMASTYLKLTERDTGKDLGTHLASVFFGGTDMAEKVQAGDKSYDLALRFKRTYKPYTLTLIDVSKDDYLGTSTPKNYSSLVQLRDPARNVDREEKIWMNNPLRYAGETFYQSGYDRGRNGKEVTTLQLVTNTGWMIPYVSCMLVSVGMLAHFTIVLVRFLRRQAESLSGVGGVVDAMVGDKPQGRGGKRARRQKTPVASGGGGALGIIVPTLLVLIFAGWLAGKARLPRDSGETMNFYEFGQLPIVYQGRVKPIDTLARTSLRNISDREELVDATGHKQPAVRWLLDAITRSESGDKDPFFRIQNLEVLHTLGLERRPGFRYSVEELSKNIAEFEKQTDKARLKKSDQLDVYEKKILDLEHRVRTYTLLSAAFRPVPFPPLPSEPAAATDRDKQQEELRPLVMAAMEAENQLKQMEAPLAVPMAAAGKEPEQDPWLPYATAWNKSYLRQTLLKGEPIPAAVLWNAIFTAYERGDATAFNLAVARYQDWLAANMPAGVGLKKVSFEAYINHFAPFYHCDVLYFVAFVLAACAWIGFSKPLNRAAFWLMVITFAVHTLAIGARMVISGRPPVTNLYSSAVFIGWACVLAGLVLEYIYRLGLGNIVASVAGFLTLLVAHSLAGSGDTFTVMQAVLDTQFWLATHVVTVALGYSATFVACLLGVLFILLGVLTTALKPDVAKVLSRVTYGVLCFAVFFSFVGTVLGGLWADDSWGRFWGWDPKENGALIIVLWNVLILHALWSRMVRERGLAVLSVAGGIVTIWSWFGVNELGVGLHSYGFTEGVLPTLGISALILLLIMAIGLLPLRLWASFRSADSVPAEGIELVTAQVVG
ncbi:MAG: cytochrome c biogenesis protein CcsA [Planctomycetota bacterium]|nr:cytochrome c biogenesis protein CcsA [Planctomycetota bacterium]